MNPVAGPEAWLDGPEGGTDGRTYVRTDVRTYVQNLPILQDFVPYRSRCPKSTGLKHRTSGGLAPQGALQVPRGFLTGLLNNYEQGSTFSDKMLNFSSYLKPLHLTEPNSKRIVTPI